jgi:HAD superfamily hydrolase (TIGR01509 family)
MIKCVIFDFDGTLVDSMKMIYEALNDALGKRGLPTIELDLLGRMAGRPLNDIISVKVHVPESVLKAIERDVFGTYTRYCRTSCQLFPNVENVLKNLKSKQLKLGLLTTTPREPLEVAVKKFALADYFEIILAKEDVKNKPDPDGIERIVRTFVISKNECLYVGDSPTDILTGKAAGVGTVAIPTGVTTIEQLRASKPDIIITDVEQLLTYIS